MQIGGVQRIFHAHLLGFELKGYHQMHQTAVEHFSSEDGWDIGHQRTLVSRTVYLIKVHKILFNFIRGNSGSKSCHPHIILSCNFSNSFVFVIILRFEDKMDPTLFDMLVNIWTAMAVNFFACWLLCRCYTFAPLRCRAMN